MDDELFSRWGSPLSETMTGRIGGMKLPRQEKGERKRSCGRGKIFSIVLLILVLAFIGFLVGMLLRGASMCLSGNCSNDEMLRSAGDDSVDIEV